MVTIERFDGNSFVDISGSISDWKIDHGVSDVKIAPTATIRTTREANVSAGETLRITDDGTLMFEGGIERAPVSTTGTDKVEASADAVRFFEDTVSITVSNPSAIDVLEAAIAESAVGNLVSLNWVGTDVSLGDEYAVTDRSCKRIFRDITDRTGRVWWTDLDGTIHVGERGARGTFAAVDTATDGAEVREYDDSDTDTIINVQTVNGTAGERVTATATDSTSINEFGRRAGDPVNVSYISSQAEAQAYADELLVPDPLARAEVNLTASVGDLRVPIVNSSLDVTDASGTGMNRELPIEAQTIRQGNATVALGEGAGANVAKLNRQQKSSEDKFEGDNLDKIKGTLDDVEDGSNFGKILQSAISSGRHTLEAAVGDLDNINDGGTFARVREGNVDSDNFVLLATSRGDLDDIDDGDDFGKVVTTALDAGEIVLAEAVGDLDDIEDGGSFGKVSITNLTPGGAVFSSGVSIDEGDGKTLNDMTTTDFTKNTTVIEGGEIETGSLTADEIDVLDLDTDQLTITGENINTSLIFEEDSFSDDYFIYPDGGADLRIGKDTDPVDNIVTFQAAPPSDNTGQIGTPSQAYTGVTAYNFNDAATGQPINDGGDPLAGLASGSGPPEYAEQTDADGETTGYSINKMARGVWDVVRAQQRVISDLEDRLAALEGDNA